MSRAQALADAIAAGNADRAAVLAAMASRHVRLPLRYWRQQVHLTTPATDPIMARKAVEDGTAAMPRILARLGISAADLAEELELPATLVEAHLAAPRRAPLVMLDGEDAIAPGEVAAQRAIGNAANLFATADWGDAEVPSLRFYRPPGLNLESSVHDLLTLLWQLREHRTAGGHNVPLDGIVFPKIGHPEEADLIIRLLDRAETELQVRAGSIRVALLVESGSAASQLAAIAQAAASRLSALIFGLADFSADLGLPALHSRHTLSEWARAEIVSAAGAVGVPAIDGMTLDYPVIDPALDVNANRRRWLSRMRLVFDDAVHARELGMLGKWVGHPAQLFAVLLAYEAGLTDEAIEGEAAKLRAYADAIANEQGATVIDGVMSDRATDRHARVLLRQATALGRFEPGHAENLGIIDHAERGDAERAYRARNREIP